MFVERLKTASPTVQKQMLGERLYPKVKQVAPQVAGKITGMMLEMDNDDVLALLESDAQLLGKIEEATKVLHAAGMQI